jgi:hypothetical protein
MKAVLMLSKEKIRKVFWSTIILGLLLPLVAMAAVDIIKDAKTITAILKDIVSFYFHDYTDLGFLFWLFQSLVFVALAFLVKSKLEGKAASSEPSALRYSEAICAWVVMVLFSVSMNIDILISSSSTAALGYIFIPFYEVVMILIGYVLGWIIGKSILWYSNRTKAA